MTVKEWVIPRKRQRKLDSDPKNPVFFVVSLELPTPFAVKSFRREIAEIVHYGIYLTEKNYNVSES